MILKIIECQSKTEAVRNVDSQNEIADLIGIEVHNNHSTLNYCNTQSRGSYEISSSLAKRPIHILESPPWRI